MKLKNVKSSVGLAALVFGLDLSSSIFTETGEDVNSIFTMTYGQEDEEEDLAPSGGG